MKTSPKANPNFLRFDLLKSKLSMALI
jgi:hypothetical protein